jgi:DNA ligase-1
MLKSLDGKYKFGRSTVKSQQLLKRKLFVDSEFEIVGFEPKYHNANEAVINELGRTSRSTSKEGLVALDTLGALLCKTPSGTIFGVGTGFDGATRKSLWDQRESLLGQLAKVKYFEVGMQDGVPRFPVYISIRSELDMSN